MYKEFITDCSWSNIAFIHGKIRAVVLIFNGLGGGVQTQVGPQERELAEHNVLTIMPYYGPWSWMNRIARQLVDDLVEAVYAEYQLDDSVPLISCGGSMGGGAALLYCRYGKRKPIGCEVLYPVCDAVYHFNERPDVRTSMRVAFYGYAEPFEAVLEEHSPLHQASMMPDIPYCITHGDADTQVNVSHSDRMVEALKKLNYRVDYERISGMGHGGSNNVPLRIWQKRVDFVLDLIKKQS